MIKRIVEISQRRAHLSVSMEQLNLDLQTEDPPGIEHRSIPCEDIGMLVLQNPHCTCTSHALAKLMENGAAVVVCGGDRHPAGLLLPLSSNTEVALRVNEQIEAGKVIKKRLWRQIVTAKIRAQAANIYDNAPAQKRLLRIAADVKSGDKGNAEAVAAKSYWQAWLGDDTPFRRNRNAPGLNGMLNYGYAIIRAAVARAVVSSGLYPAIGIHHRNRSNTFCLADDLMEPLRPMVDFIVRDMHYSGHADVNTEVKRRLLGLLHETVRTGDDIGPLMVALHRLSASLVRCFRKEQEELEIPEPLSSSLDRDWNGAQRV